MSLMWFAIHGSAQWATSPGSAPAPSNFSRKASSHSTSQMPYSQQHSYILMHSAQVGLPSPKCLSIAAPVHPSGRL